MVAEYAIMRDMRALSTPDAACKSWVHCRRRYREPSFAAAEVSPCGQGKEVGLVSYSTTLTPPLGSDPRSPRPSESDWRHYPELFLYVPDASIRAYKSWVEGVFHRVLLV